jgi:hypothetical protein
MTKNITIIKPSEKVTVIEKTAKVIEVSPVPRTGPKGEPGSKIITKDGPPSPSDGVDGDYYLQSDGQGLPFFGPKVNGQWPSESIFLNVTSRFVFEQGTPLATWDIFHPLGGYPSVSIVDSSKTVVVGTVEYRSTSHITVSFSSPFSGTAFLT